MTIDTPAWVRDAVFYQVFPDRFASSDRVAKPGPLQPWLDPPTAHGFKGGDLLGIAEHLDDLQDLGITALYLTPIFQSASNHRYHAYDYLAVDPLLGGTPAFRELLDACHSRGMRVVLDGVFNHAGRGFWAFHHVLENGAASPYRDWFVFDQEALDLGRPVRAYPTADERRALEAGGSERAHREGDVSLRQLGLPGLVGPARPAQVERDQPGGARVPARRGGALGPLRHRRLAPGRSHGDRGRRVLAGVPSPCQGDQSRGLHRRGDLAGSAGVADRRPIRRRHELPAPRGGIGFSRGRRLDMDVVRAQAELARTVMPLDAGGFAARLHDLLAAYDPAVTSVQLNLLDSHDTPRFVTMAGGDRDALKLAVLLQMTLPGAPCVYYGDEIGLEGAADPDCRRAFPWDRSAWDHDLRAFVRSAIQLRHAHPALRSVGTVETLQARGMTHVHVRRGAGELFIVAVNAGEDGDVVDIDLPDVDGMSLRAEPLPGWDLAARPRVPRFEAGT